MRRRFQNAVRCPRSPSLGSPFSPSITLRLGAACIALYGSAAHALALDEAATPVGQTLTRAGTLAATTGAAANFDGSVRVEPLTAANADIHATSAYVTFAPGAHSVWHTHPKGQYLVVTAGVGLTQEWGKPVQVLHPGDIVWCPPGVKHWHGATPEGAMTHLAITGVDEGRSVIWMERVTDAQYHHR